MRLGRGLGVPGPRERARVPGVIWRRVVLGCSGLRSACVREACLGPHLGYLGALSSSLGHLAKTRAGLVRIKTKEREKEKVFEFSKPEYIPFSDFRNKISFLRKLVRIFSILQLRN